MIKAGLSAEGVVRAVPTRENNEGDEDDENREHGGEGAG
jgi:hypothetical protein